MDNLELMRENNKLLKELVACCKPKFRLVSKDFDNEKFIIRNKFLIVNITDSFNNIYDSNAVQFNRSELQKTIDKFESISNQYRENNQSVPVYNKLAVDTPLTSNGTETILNKLSVDELVYQFSIIGLNNAFTGTFYQKVQNLIGIITETDLNISQTIDGSGMTGTIYYLEMM